MRTSPEHDLSAATWHKSTYSDGSGGNCLEVARDFPGAAHWRKSTHSGGEGGNCLEVATWRKASYSGGSGSDCLEVADGHPGLVPVRDSKTPTGPKLAFRATAWSAFITNLKAS